MPPGQRRFRAIIQTPQEVQSASGEVSTVWVDLRTVWAAVVPMRGQQYFASQQVQAGQAFAIRLAYKTGYRTNQRIRVPVEGGFQIYDIIDVIDPHMRHRTIELMCRLRESDGFLSQKP